MFDNLSRFQPLVYCWWSRHSYIDWCQGGFAFTEGPLFVKNRCVPRTLISFLFSRRFLTHVHIEKWLYNKLDIHLGMYIVYWLLYLFMYVCMCIRFYNYPVFKLKLAFNIKSLTAIDLYLLLTNSQGMLSM